MYKKQTNKKKQDISKISSLMFHRRKKIIINIGLDQNDSKQMMTEFSFLGELSIKGMQNYAF